jgi:hypothetical protein
MEREVGRSLDRDVRMAWGWIAKAHSRLAERWMAARPVTQWSTNPFFATLSKRRIALDGRARRMEASRFRHRPL